MTTNEERDRANLIGLLKDREAEGFLGHMAQELSELSALLIRRYSRPMPQRYVSCDADALSAQRVAIDRRIASLNNEMVGDEETDPILGLIADLVEYRIALWNLPVGYDLTEAGEAALEEGAVLAVTEELQYETVPCSSHCDNVSVNVTVAR